MNRVISFAALLAGLLAGWACSDYPCPSPDRVDLPLIDGTYVPDTEPAFAGSVRIESIELEGDALWVRFERAGEIHVAQLRQTERTVAVW